MPWRISRMTRQWTRDRLNLHNDLNLAAAFGPLPYFCKRKARSGCFGLILCVAEFFCVFQVCIQITGQGDEQKEGIADNDEFYKRNRCMGEGHE